MTLEPDEEVYQLGEPEQFGPDCPLCSKPLGLTDEMVRRAAVAFYRPESEEGWVAPPVLLRNMRAALEAAPAQSETSQSETLSTDQVEFIRSVLHAAAIQSCADEEAPGEFGEFREKIESARAWLATLEVNATTSTAGQAPSEAKEPSTGEQADPGSVPSPEGVRSAALAESFWSAINKLGREVGGPLG